MKVWGWLKVYWKVIVGLALVIAAAVLYVLGKSDAETSQLLGLVGVAFAGLGQWMQKHSEALAAAGSALKQYHDARAAGEPFVLTEVTAPLKPLARKYVEKAIAEEERPL